MVEKDRELLEAIAQALLERETLNREEVETLARGEELPPFHPESESGASDGGEEAPDAAAEGVSGSGGDGSARPAGAQGPGKDGEDLASPEKEDAPSEAEPPVSSPAARRARERTGGDLSRG